MCVQWATSLSMMNCCSPYLCVREQMTEKFSVALPMPTSIQDTLPAALANADNLPSLPGVAVNILKLSEDENAELEDYARVISMDPALAVQILKLANSSLYNLGQEIATLERATMMLGTKTVQLMSLSFSLVGQIPAQEANGAFNYAEYWKRSLSSAVAGRELGRLFGLALAEEAFLCGLLARIGQLVIAECMPSEYAHVIGDSPHLPTAEAEQAKLGFTHTDIGASLLKSWGLPDALYLSVAYLNDPEQLPDDADSSTRELVKIAHLANLIAGVLCDQDKGSALAELHKHAKKAGLSSEQVHTLILALESRINETASLLDIEIADKVSHYEILDAARKQLVSISVATVRDLKSIQRRASDGRAAGFDQSARITCTPEQTDELTGLGDADFLRTCLNQEINYRSRAANEVALGSIGLLMVGIAEFDAIVDDFGNQFAEQAISVVGQTLRGISRGTDIPVRFSAHVYALLIPSADAAALHAVAGRIINTVAEMPIVAGHNNFRIQALVGVCTLESCTQHEDGDRLIKLAKQALAKAKIRGPGSLEFLAK